MADRVSEKVRSRIMASVGSKDTGPEMALRRALWSLGYRYRVHYDLPGRPDIAFPGSHVAVFVDGCFWHGCPIHGSDPSTNSDFWQEKFARNRSRDRRVDAELRDLGWTVVRVWEHEVKGSLDRAVEKVTRTVVGADGG